MTALWEWIDRLPDLPVLLVWLAACLVWGLMAWRLKVGR